MKKLIEKAFGIVIICLFVSCFAILISDSLHTQNFGELLIGLLGFFGLPGAVFLGKRDKKNGVKIYY